MADREKAGPAFTERAARPYDGPPISLPTPISAKTWETAMTGLLNGIRTLIGDLIGDFLSREPTIRLRGNSGRDWLPPVLGPSDWSQGLIDSMADNGTAWYFDRH
jgi:hypothetical protein